MSNVVSLFDKDRVTKRRRHYETVYIVVPSLDEQAAGAIFTKALDVLTDAKATILRKDEWGKRKMAYPIEKHVMGRYYYLRYTGGTDAVKAVERSLKLDASVLRWNTLRLSDPLSAEEEQRLIEKAPNEPTTAPSIRFDDEDYSFDSPFSSR